MLTSDPLSLLLLLLLGVQGGRASDPASDYRLAPAESSLRVFVGKAGFLSVLAHDHNIGVRDFSGRLVIPPGGIPGARLELKIDTRSMAVLDAEVSDGDRAKITRSMHEEVLESAKYPEAVFRSTGLTGLTELRDGEVRFQLGGDLTLHGQTRPITLPVVVRRTPGLLKATGRYVLRQTDYGIRPYSTAGGAIKVKNEVVIDFQITARSQ